MIKNEIYDPLTEYVNVFRDRFKEVAERTFAKLAEEANVDVEANRKTCKEFYKTDKARSEKSSQVSTWKFWRGFLWVVIIISACVCFVEFQEYEPDSTVVAVSALLPIALLIAIFAWINPRITNMKSERDELAKKAKELKDLAWEQMTPLNSLYDWDILTRMMTETVPKLEFDPYFTTQRLADLEKVYGWNGSFNETRSVICSHSGLINGNPFVFCRTKKMIMGQKTYWGEKTIYWTTYERDSDGKTRAVHHSEILRASVTKPYPEYYKKTRLIYGNTAAPDLKFSRKQSDLAGKEGSLSYKWTRHKLRKKARDLENNDFAMMTNEDFEIAFDTRNRNDNQQFALLFTPLAQESMLNLLKDKSVGYGDDFDFEKNKMINVIVADHMQELQLDLNPTIYRTFDFDKAKVSFQQLNSEYFRAIYFCMAPLLCVPMYQQIRSQQDIYGRDMELQSAFWEHEALANFYGKSRFEAPDCVTDCILKTRVQRHKDGISTITVTAHGYRTEQHLTYIEKYGGDGNWHDVPVYWDEYIPVTGEGEMEIKEDNEKEDSDMSNTARIAHINGVLSETGLDIYRRHIASSI